MDASPATAVAKNEPATEPLPCPNCGATLLGRYCHECGQKRIEPAERRFSWFVAQLAKALVMADSRLLRSLGRLLFRPGALDRAWLAGRRRTHLAPLNLFLLANLLYFFHPPLTDLNLALHDQFTQPGYGPLATALAEARVETRGTSLAAYAAEYAAQATALAKLMVILHVPLLAIVLAALHVRRRIFYVDHIAVALHFWAFVLLHAMVTPPLLAAAHAATGAVTAAAFQLVMLGVLVLYGWQQLNTGYGQSRWLAAAKLPLFLIGLVVSHLLYRFAQFLGAFALT
jgi:hypothetical protein